ncbi:response regulator [Candidatus Latescibacterota bacterium]
MNKEIYTAMEVAKILRLSLPTINRLLKSGELKGFRSSKNANWKITEKELVKYFKDHDIPMEFLYGYKVKVLIVDDEIFITQLVEDTFREKEKFLIESANSGFMAGIKLESFKPDVVILDIFLNDMDGREFFKHIRENPELNKTKVIGISGKIAEDEIKPMLDLGFDYFLAKPFTTDTLIETVLKAVGV